MVVDVFRVYSAGFPSLQATLERPQHSHRNLPSTVCQKNQTNLCVRPRICDQSKRRSLSSNWQFDRLIWKTQKQIVLTPDSLFETIKLFIVIMLGSISSFFFLFYKSNFTKKLTQLFEEKTGKEKLRERWEVSETDSEPRRRENIYILVTSWFLVW